MVNGVVLVMVVVGIVWMNVREKQGKMRQLKYLLSIPPAELKSNRYVRKFAMGYCIR